MENFENSNMDAALERLLKRATDPTIPQGAESRLMASIRATEQKSNVVQLRQRPPASRWLVGLPLAASLLLGIYLGIKGTIDSYLPDSILGTSIAGATDADISSGLDDVENYTAGEVT